MIATGDCRVFVNLQKVNLWRGAMASSGQTVVTPPADRRSARQKSQSCYNSMRLFGRRWGGIDSDWPRCLEMSVWLLYASILLCSVRLMWAVCAVAISAFR